jgi:hypothetical protein
VAAAAAAVAAATTTTCTYLAVLWNPTVYHYDHKRTFKADSHIACRAHAVPLPCREAKGLECVFLIRFKHSAAVSDSHLPCRAHAML